MKSFLRTMNRGVALAIVLFAGLIVFFIVDGVTFAKEKPALKDWLEEYLEECAKINLLPEQYRELFQPFDRYILEQYEYNLVHLHACGLHHVPALAEIEGLRCVEITIEKELNGYSFERIRKAVEILQNRDISVIILGELSHKEVEQYLSVFEPRGLALYYWLPME